MCCFGVLMASASRNKLVTTRNEISINVVANESEASLLDDFSKGNKGGHFFGFASDCELRIAREICRDSPDDAFCSAGTLDVCQDLQFRCAGFEVDHCSSHIECCACSFPDCPMSKEGCARIASECFYSDFVSLNIADEVLALRPAC